MLRRNHHSYQIQFDILNSATTKALFYDVEIQLNEMQGLRPLRMHMDNIMVWNVRGLNRRNKQNEVRRFISSHNIKLFSLLKTKMKMASMGKFVSTSLSRLVLHH